MKNSMVELILDNKFALYPFGKRGKEIYKRLKEEIGVVPDIIVDNYYEGTGDILKISDIHDFNSYYWILGTDSLSLYVQLKEELREYGVEESKILDIYDNQKKIISIMNDGIKKQLHYNDVIMKLKGVVTRIKFGAYICYDESNGANTLIRLMIESPMYFDVKIVVIPDVSKGTDYQIIRYKKTYESMINTYGEKYIIDGYDIESNRIIDCSKLFDVIYCANPYDSMVHQLHSIAYLSGTETLIIHIPYAYEGARIPLIWRAISPEMNYVWKLFVDSEVTYEEYKKYQPIECRNVIVSGYAKMDDLILNEEKNDKKRKKILIASHHTVDMKDLPLSNFLKYSDEIKYLPYKYKMVDFVFRPHPLLFHTLVSHGYWSDDDVTRYIDEIKTYGMEYSTEGNYLQLFNECDAIIHDCGSYTEEWLLTGKPGCFMMNERLSDSHMTSLMKKSLKYYSIARTFSDVEDFIDNVLENRPVDIRDEWIKNNIMVNYPNVSLSIFNMIKNTLI